jgi:hypothetical protein
MFPSHRNAWLAAVALSSLILAPATAHERLQDAAPATKPATPAKVIPEADLPADPRFSPDRVKADVAFLADDLLEGRDTGSVGYEIAANYVAQRFASLGLRPMGDKGGWLQRIQFQRTERLQAPSAIAISGPKGSGSFAASVDSLFVLGANETKLDLTAPMVFVGYGLEHKALGLDDYAGLDLKGKIAVMLRGYPEDVPSETAAHLVSERLKTAEAHGAIGSIVIDTESSARLRPWERRLLYGFQPSVTWIGPDGKAFDETPGLRFTGSVNDKGAEAIFAGARRSLADVRRDAARKGGKPRGFALAATAHITAEAQRSTISSPNVVAMLPGSDPKLASEYVMLSGHLDHLGIMPAKPGEPANADRIANGAMDNAAGVATLLEVAHVLAEDKNKPRRSVVFLVVTAEEKGLLGAEYYSRYPTVPIGSIVGNVNLDMPLLTYAFTDLIAFGAEHSTLGAQVAAAVKPMNIKLSPDPMPEEVVFVRSDHYMFVKQGVPAVFLVTGYANGGEAASRLFEDTYYHQVGDDMNLPFNWRAGARFAEANYRITRALTDADTRPLWLKGDFFGDLFAPKAPKATQ